MPRSECVLKFTRQEVIEALRQIAINGGGHPEDQLELPPASECDIIVELADPKRKKRFSIYLTWRE